MLKKLILLIILYQQRKGGFVANNPVVNIDYHGLEAGGYACRLAEFAEFAEKRM